MKICENCGKEHEGTYGSGRFCSTKCSRGFSTKAKRKEINKQVGLKLKIIRDDVEITCLECGKIKIVPWRQRNNKCCSKSCSSRLVAKDKDYIENLSKKRIQKIIDGHVNNYGTKMIYTFNDEKIRCDSKIEYACLEYFKTKGADSMKRCNFSIEYKDCNKTRRFNPDFEIKINNDIYIVEAKSYMSIKSVNKKWRNYNELSILKKEALNNFCNLNNFIPFWFTKDLNRKFYNNVSVA